MSRDTETRIVRWLQAIFITAALMLLFTIGNTATNWRVKTTTEERLDALEWGRKDQQKRNEGQDELNKEFKQHILKESH